MTPDTKGLILIIDDEQSFAMTTAALLTREGYTCSTAYTHDSALQAVEDTHFDTILCDINMTGNLRLELTTALSERSSSTPIILVTGYPSLDTAIQAVGLSVFAYILKPLEFTQFLKTVGEAVVRGRAVTTMRRAKDALAQTTKALSAEMQAVTGRQSSSFQNELEAYVAFTQHNLLSSLSDLYSLVQASAGVAREQNSLQLLDCPPLREHRKLLEEAVQVLEKTRSAFKSKDLAILRQKIETFLASSPL